MKVLQIFQEKLENLIEHAKSVQEGNKEPGKVCFMHICVWYTMEDLVWA